MPRKTSLTVEKLSKDINFFYGYIAECELLLPFNANVNNTLEYIKSEYQQEDLIISHKVLDSGDITLYINGTGEKQINSLINIISEDYNVIDCQLESITEC
tara:strand:- start:1407 stop:1709 length:303 start_codon:yes stop_codon:yes gene_type:complete